MLCATGAGARADPTRIRIADISESAQDPLSRAVRHRLKREHGITGGVTVVLSTEKPQVSLCGLPSTDSTGAAATALSPLEFQIVPGFRVRTIPVLGPLPAIFGLTMASYVVTQLAQFEVSTEPVVELRAPQYETVHTRLIEREEATYGSCSEVEVDADEVRYLVRDIWHGRSGFALAREGQLFTEQKDRDRQLSLTNGVPDKAAWEWETANVKRKGGWVSTRQLTLARWDSRQSAHVGNLVLMTEDEADELQRLRMSNPNGNPVDVIQHEFPIESRFIEERIRAAKRMFGSTSWNGGRHWEDTGRLDS